MTFVGWGWEKDKNPYRFRCTRSHREFDSTKAFFEYFREMRGRSEVSYQLIMRRDRKLGTADEVDLYLKLAEQNNAFGFQYQSPMFVIFFFEREEDEIIMRLKHL